jgi:anti-sigma-K factor RskA
MTNQPEITPEDLALYAMQLLDAREMREIEAFLATSSEARQELARIAGDLASFAMSSEMQTPPVLAKQRLLKQVAREKKAVPFATFEDAAAPVPHRERESLAPHQGPVFSSYKTTLGEDDDQEPRRNLFGLIFPWVGWATAAGLAFFALNLYTERDSLRTKVRSQASALSTANESSERAQLVLDTLASASAQRFTLTKTDVRPPAMGRVVYLADRGSLIFQGSNLDPIPATKTYELWLIPAAEGRQPVPAGTFRPDERGFASIILPDMPKGLVASKFGVTIEDEGGSQAPTLPIVMVGQ